MSKSITVFTRLATILALAVPLATPMISHAEEPYEESAPGFKAKVPSLEIEDADSLIDGCKSIATLLERASETAKIDAVLDGFGKANKVLLKALNTALESASQYKYRPTPHTIRVVRSGLKIFNAFSQDTARLNGGLADAAMYVELKSITDTAVRAYYELDNRYFEEVFSMANHRQHHYLTTEREEKEYYGEESSEITSGAHRREERDDKFFRNYFDGVRKLMSWMVNEQLENAEFQPSYHVRLVAMRALSAVGKEVLDLSVFRLSLCNVVAAFDDLKNDITDRLNDGQNLQVWSKVASHGLAEIGEALRKPARYESRERCEGEGREHGRKYDDRDSDDRRGEY